MAKNFEGGKLPKFTGFLSFYIKVYGKFTTETNHGLDRRLDANLALICLRKEAQTNRFMVKSTALLPKEANSIFFTCILLLLDAGSTGILIELRRKNAR
jgi:hypothetical protein